jgi:hypothetical protein
MFVFFIFQHWELNLEHARQVLYCLSHIPRAFVFILVLRHDLPRLLKFMILLPPAPEWLGLQVHVIMPGLYLSFCAYFISLSIILYIHIVTSVKIYLFTYLLGFELSASHLLVKRSTT